MEAYTYNVRFFTAGKEFVSRADCALIKEVKVEALDLKTLMDDIATAMREITQEQETKQAVTYPVVYIAQAWAQYEDDPDMTLLMMLRLNSATAIPGQRYDELTTGVPNEV